MTHWRSAVVPRLRVSALLALLMVAASSCVDSPTVTAANAPAADDPLAQTFDALAVSSGSDGDLARKEGFEIAALAVRSGITPGHLDVRIAALDAEGMDAIVSVVDWATAISSTQRPPTRRSVVAWRRNANGVLRVVSVLTPSDSAPIVSPLSLGAAVNSVAVYAAASAQYQDITPQASGAAAVKTSWFATSGWVKVRQLQSLGACAALPTNSKIGGFACERARYAVAFNLSMQTMTGLPPVLVSDLAIAVLTPTEQQLEGERVTFACLSPTSDKGCK